MVNSVFLAAALGAGLDMAILNPLSARYRDTVNTFRVLNGQDAGARAFLENYAHKPDPYDGDVAQTESPTATSPTVSGTAQDARCPIAISEEFAADADGVRSMVDLVLAGRKAPMVPATESLLACHDPIAIINDVFVPVLDVVGARYESGAFSYPQPTASAEAVKAGFDVIRERTRQQADAECEGASEGPATP